MSKMKIAGQAHTTPSADKRRVVLKVDGRPLRLAQNKEYLKDANVQAFLKTISWAEGGNYHARYGYGWAKGNWNFTDESTHPGAGYGGTTTAAGAYQITIDTWKDNGIAQQGLTDFSPHTQDLIAVEILRRVGSIDNIIAGELSAAIGKAAKRWQALPMGPGLANRPGSDGKPSKQPYKTYGDVASTYKNFAGVMAE